MAIPAQMPMPASIESERALLGSIILAPELFADAQAIVSPCDFYRDTHRTIFAALAGLSARHTPIGAVAVVDYLGDAEARRVGGLPYLSSLYDGVPIGREFCQQFAETVREKSRLRQLISAAESISAAARSGQQCASDLADEAVARLLALEGSEGATASSFRDAAISLLGMLERKDLLRIETGIAPLDAVTGGFLAGELVLFTAEVGAGKTLLAQQMRRHSCAHGRHGLFASAEMTKEQLAARELATTARVERYKMRFPERITPDNWQSLTRAAARECERCEILDGEITLQRVNAAAARMKRDGRLSFVVIDYDELLSAPGRDEMERQSAIAKAAKSLAKSMAVPVVLISQLRKLLQGENRRMPTLDRLHGSAAKKKHAATVIFAWRKYLETHAKEDQPTAALVVLKNRNGTQGRVPVYFDVQTLSFRALTQDEELAFEDPHRAENRGKRAPRSLLPDA